jgi:hypothetical protein
MVRADRVPTGKGVHGWLEGAPDLAVEVVGDSQSISEMTQKALEYIAGGAKMCGSSMRSRVASFSSRRRIT